MNQQLGLVSLVVRDYDAYVAKGITFVRLPAEEPYGTVAVFMDVYGNRWDLVQLRDGR